MRAVLVESHEIAPEIRHFTFEVPDTERFSFKAGQFVSLSAPIGGRTITRAYSLASREHGNRFELCLNRVEDGLFSPFLFAMQPGDAVDLSGPLGYFHWREPARDSILVATGTGIAPFRGMLQEPLPGNAKVTLVFGVRYEPNLMYRQEFESLAASQPNFRFLPVLSRADDSWSGRRGHVQSHVLDTLGGNRDVNVYMCGMKAMVDDLRQQLKALGFDRRQIIYEKYD
ncbi:phenol hydroxylase [Bryobacterales bacterium F-183]|nr:phenol hydroxylase [Bryobacterales bacterium F-183]